MGIRRGKGRKVCSMEETMAGMTYALTREVMEEYVLTVPGEEPWLLDICLTQKVGEQSDPADYARLRDELLAGIELV